MNGVPFLMGSIPFTNDITILRKNNQYDSWIPSPSPGVFHLVVALLYEIPPQASMRSAAALSALRNDLRTARCHKYRDLEGETKLVGWFQIFVYVHLYLGKIPSLIFFFKWVAQPPTRTKMSLKVK